MYKPYPKDLLNEIKTSIDNFRKESSSALCAAFDADGTLWDMDVGEIVFDHQINHWDLDLPSDPWTYYRDLKKENPTAAYLWLAQILSGKSLEEVLAKNHEAYTLWERDNGPLPIYPAQRELIKWLQENGVEVYIVTASVRWSVFYGAKLLSIPVENVLGVQTKVINGIVSDTQEGEITFREGKARQLISNTEGKTIVFSCGNTMGDYELLKSSKGQALAVMSADESEDLYATEKELQEKAHGLKWLNHRFR